jgi:hypothetical protein
MLTADDLHDAFTELALKARADGLLLEIAIYGGSALLLASNFRTTTLDVDAVADADQMTIQRYAAEIAAVRRWPVTG